MVWCAQYDDWSCRKSHVIKGVAGAGTNYQVAMNIHYGLGSDYQEDVYLSGICKNDFSDIRFTVYNGVSESSLNYWIESIDEQNDVAKVWVKITENLDNDCTIYLYYGNSSATSESNGASTFDFFDDFTSSPNNWTLSGAQITNGKLVLVSGGGTFQYAMKERPANLDNYRFRLKAQSFLTNCGWGAYPRASHNPPCTSYSPYYYVPFFEVFDYWYARDHHAYYHAPDGGCTDPRSDYSVDPDWHTYEVRKSGNNYSHCYDDSQTGTVYCTTPETGNWVAFTPLGGAPAANTNFDWVFLGKYLENGPYHDNTWTTGIPNVSVNWYDLNWSYRKGHVILGSQGAGSNYPIQINVHYGEGNDSGSDVYVGSNCVSDFRDIRFTGSDGISSLSYWIESIDNDVAKVWVNVADNLDEDQIIYLYYGNSDAETMSDGTATFPFFDDFNYSPNNWTLSGTQIDDGNLVLVGGVSEFQYAQKTRPLNMDDYRFRFKVKSLLTNGGWAAYPRATHDPPTVSSPPYYYEPFFRVYDYYNTNLTLVGYDTTDEGSTSPEMQNPKDTNWHIVEITKSGSSYTARWDQLSATRTCTTPEEGATIAFSPYSHAPNNHTYIDWVFLGKYVETEPAHSIWEPESTLGWFSQDWSHRKNHTIYGVVGAGTNYQVSLNIHYSWGNDSKDHVYLGNICKNDFSDIRFTGSDGTSQLAYWIESIENDTAKIWVKIDDVLGDSETGYDRTIFIYYGNASATSESSGTDTFVFFDDFSSTNNWTLSGGTAITDGNLVISGAGNETQYAQKTRPENMDNYRFKFKVKSNLTNGGWAAYPAGKDPLFTSGQPNAPYFRVSDYDSSNLTLVDYVTADGENCTTLPEMETPKDTDWHTVEITKTDSSYTARWDDQSAIAICDTAENGSVIAFTPYGAAPNNDTLIDWVFMAKYMQNEPDHAEDGQTQPEEQSIAWSSQYDDWTHRKEHVISGAFGAGENYTVAITLHNGAGYDYQGDVYLFGMAQDDFKDIRFTGWNEATQNQTPLNYWIESIDNDTAKVWVKLNETLDDDCTVFLYYGNSDPELTSESNGAETFDFFDDFSSSPNNWTLSGETAIADGNLKISGAGNETQYAQKARPESMDNYRFKFKVKSQLTSGGWAIYTRNASNAPFFKASDYSNENLTLVDYVTADNGTTSPEMVNPKDTDWHTVEVTKFNSIYTTRWDQLSAMRTCSTAENGSTITFAPIGNPDNDTYFDWVFMHRYVETEPTHQDSWKTETHHWFNDKWSSRKSHTIHGAVGAGTDYQIAVIVHHGMGNDSGSEVYLDEIGNEDFSDLRFTSSDGLTSLSYWIESVENDTALVWVKIAESLGDAENAYDRTLHMYYGNPTALSESDPYETFVFFDDFNGAVLDDSKWFVDIFSDPFFGIWDQASYAVEYSKLVLTAPPDSFSEVEITCKEAYPNCGLRMKARASSNSGIVNLGGSLIRPYADELGWVFTHGYGLLLPNVGASLTVGQWRTYFINYYQNTGQFQEGQDLHVDYTSYTTQDLEFRPYFACGVAEWNVEYCYLEIDWIAVKKCTNSSLEPYHEDQWTRHGPSSIENITPVGGNISPVFNSVSNTIWLKDEVTGLSDFVIYNGGGNGIVSTAKWDEQKWETDKTNGGIIHIGNPSTQTYCPLIENLIIDGNNMPNQVGIVIENTRGAQIRNVTIKDCEVGILIKNGSDDERYSEATNITNVTMINVKKGIVFNSKKEGSDNSKSFAYTFIDAVDIKLKIDRPGAIGIELGGNDENSGIEDTLYGSLITGLIRLNSRDAVGIRVNKQCSITGAWVGLVVVNGYVPDGFGVSLNTDDDYLADVKMNCNFIIKYRNINSRHFQTSNQGDQTSNNPGKIIFTPF
ncbi:MAG: DUF2341 domain-containing protein [Candidatus Bathyarchaeota archaeon]|nr:DUF2341 domain-containing protein [Candidatus Bathyarchaeota archaeon]